jgi:hypothetical protein
MDCDNYIFVYDEPCETYHLIFDLDQDLLVVHNVSQVGHISNINLLQYTRPTYKKHNAAEICNDVLRDVRRLFIS